MLWLFTPFFIFGVYIAGITLLTIIATTSIYYAEALNWIPVIQDIFASLYVFGLLGLIALFPIMLAADIIRARKKSQ